MTASRLFSTRRAFVAGVAGLGLAAAIAGCSNTDADSTNISDKEALARQEAGKMIIVDVRTPPEWQQTGIARGALKIEMQDPEFVQKITQLQASNPQKQIGFICASSNRSGQVQAALVKRGFSKVYSVYGGMTGNGEVPGWIADGLPTENCC